MKPETTPETGMHAFQVKRPMKRETPQTQCWRAFPLKRHLKRYPYFSRETFHPSLRDGTVKRAERFTLKETMNFPAQRAFQAIASTLAARPLAAAYEPSFLLRRAAPGQVLTLEPKSRRTAWLNRRTA